MVSILEKSEQNVDFHPIVDFVEASHIRYALTFNPTVYVSHIQQFWSTARIETMEEGTKILATVDGNLRTVTESSIRRNLKLNDEAGISSLLDAKLFENLTLMGYNISPNQKFTFQRGECLGTSTEPHHTPSPKAQQTLTTTHSSLLLPPVTTAPIPTVTPNDTTPLRLYTRRARIAQSSALPPIADELASPIGDELEITRMKARIKLLKDKEGGGIAEQSRDATPIKGKRLDEGEAAAKRVSDDTEEMATVLTSMDVASILTSGGVQVFPTTTEVATATVSIPIRSDVVPTASLVFATATVVTPYTRRKGKEKMVETGSPKKNKIQEHMDVQMARQLEEEMERDA
nr:hypothetical protein [Tanacetum cinerariifolium]